MRKTKQTIEYESVQTRDVESARSGVHVANKANQSEEDQRIWRSRAYHDRRRRLHRLKNLGLLTLPFLFVIVGLTLTSVGVFRYIEQESILAVFLYSREAANDVDFHGVNWTPETVPVSEPTLPVEPLPTEIIVPQQPEKRLKVPFYYVGEQFAVLTIPTVDINVGIFQGDSDSELRSGAGHYSGSFFPGQDGNILVAGHRNGVFRNFEYLETGESIFVETTYGKFTYRIDELRIIEGTDMSIAADTLTEQLTLYTCYPFTFIGNAPQRYVVICSLVESEVFTG